MDMTEQEIEFEAEHRYYTFTFVPARFRVTWNMLDENTKSHWRKRVQKDI
jgi:hypothetical protein